MKTIVAIVSVFLSITAVGEETEWTQLPWSQIQKEGTVLPGRLLPRDSTTPYESLALNNVSGPVTLVTITRFKPGTGKFGFAGKVKCRGLASATSVEMVAYLSGGQKFVQEALGPDFSSALALKGNMDWTEFYVPFRLGFDPSLHPEKFELRVYHPGQGTIIFSPLAFRQAVQHPWQSEGPRFAWMGTVIWYLLLLTAILGVTIRILANGRHSRRTCFLILNLTIALGVAVTVLALIALLKTRQVAPLVPYFLLGTAQIILPCALYPRIRASYEGEA